MGEHPIDVKVPIIDTHHHLFLRATRRYLAEEFAADMASGHRIVASVYVEAGGFKGSAGFWRTDGPEQLRPLGEVEYANGVGAMAAGGCFGGRLACAGIVGHADLTQGDRIAQLLDRCMSAAPDRYRGIRQPALHHALPEAPPGIASRPPAGLLGASNFRAGFAHLAPRGLSFDVAVYDTQFGEVAALADAFPETKLVLNHMGMVFGLARDGKLQDDLYRRWRAGLADLARRPNVYCKVSGLGQALWGFGFDREGARADSAALARAWRPLVEGAVETFGAGRCMAGSNFPIDLVTAEYVTSWNALKRIVSGISDAERRRLLFGTANDVYRLGLEEAALPDALDSRALTPPA